MAYCTPVNIRDVMDMALDDDTLSNIIAQADREINAYLGVSGLSGSGDTAKSASILLSQAKAIQYRTPEANVGSYVKQAYKILDEYKDSQPSLPNTHHVFVRKVNR